uniref:Transmembrane protein 126A n=1 Tax=Schistocephalus solidus TaxID=70667 RepID=A0A0X3Q661_SCHSO
MLGMGLDAGNVKERQLQQLRHWQPQSEVWPLVHGPKMASVCVMASSFAIILRMRQFYNLFSQQHFFGTIIPVVSLPTIGYLIASDLLVKRCLSSQFANYDSTRPICTTCYELRGSVLQAAMGVVFPYMLSMFACSAAAISYRTYPTPPLNDYRKMLLTIRRSCRALGTTLTLLTLANLAFGGWLTRSMLDTHLMLSYKNSESGLAEAS